MISFRFIHYKTGSTLNRYKKLDNGNSFYENSSLSLDVTSIYYKPFVIYNVGCGNYTFQLPPGNTTTIRIKITQTITIQLKHISFNTGYKCFLCVTIIDLVLVICQEYYFSR